jgi:uncharacterized protein YlzI (FlbEa/FlbD family)
MIRLTNTVHEAEWVAPEKIIRIRKATEESVPRTRVYLQDGSYVVVTETPQEVARKVLEYRLAMVRYQALANCWGSLNSIEIATATLKDMENVQAYMLQIAGLENTHDTN